MQTNDIGVSEEATTTKETNPSPVKLPWYLTFLAIIISFIVFFPVSIAFMIMRIVKTKGTEQFKQSIIGVSSIFAVIAILCVCGIFSEQTFNAIDNAIAVGDYEQAYTLLQEAEAKNKSEYQIRNAYAKYYEAQGMYDDAADIWISYFDSISDKTTIEFYDIAKLKSLQKVISKEKEAVVSELIADVDFQKQAVVDLKETC